VTPAFATVDAGNVASELRRIPGWRAIFITTSLSRTSGGPFQSVSGLARAVAAQNRGHVMVVGGYADQALWPEDRLQWAATPLVAVPYSGLGSAFLLRDRLLSAVHETQAAGTTPLIHLHGMWDAASLSLALMPQSQAIPLVVSPRGMLEPWALGQKRLKKAVAMQLWQRSLLTRAGLLHATSHLECEGLRQLGLRGPVAIVPNGIDVPPDIGGLRDSRPANQSKESPPRRRCVFLSRLHPKKGLLMLLGAWKRIRPRGWTLEIAGSGDARHEVEVRETILRLQLDEVSLVGDLRGFQKWQFLANADMFVLPTHSENFGIAIAEAMAAGLPVITTRGTPWQVLRDQRMGWWIDAEEHAVAAALREATSESGAALRERGQRASHYAMTQFGWSAIGQRMLACYEWLLGIGPSTEDIQWA
jgi:glycosyltransferase involved in cell wall biosynthesis